MTSSRSRGVSVGSVALVALVAAACGSSSSSATTTTSTTAPATKTLTIMVTNDDGVGAPGIDAVVQALRALPHTEVSVVAPLTNQSGTGGKTTPGALTTSPSMTASHYPAIAVNGYPADTVIWAVKEHGLNFRPDLVVSGINFGQNIGPLAELSGTVGAAREAVSLGVPAIAASQGLDNGSSPNFAQSAPLVTAWVTQHRAQLVAHQQAATPLQANLNVPTCPSAPRGPVTTVMAATGNAAATETVDCSSTSTTYTNDLEAFEIGYATLTPLHPPAG